MTKGLPVKQSIFQFVDRGNEEYTFDIMCKVERGETSLQEAKQKYRMILDKRKAKISTAKRLSTIEGVFYIRGEEGGGGYLGPVHTSPFLFENAYFFIRFYRSSTLKTEMFISENGDFRKRFPERRLLKTF